MAQTNYFNHSEILIRTRTESSAKIILDDSILQGSKDYLTWSPDGNKLYFFLTSGYTNSSKMGLYVLDFSERGVSTPPKQVSEIFGRPVISPDNNYIALEPFNIESGKITIITPNGNVVWESPSALFGLRHLIWTPDSKRLFFVKYADNATPDFPVTEIASFDIQSKSVEVFEIDIRNVYAPSFSPDGKWMFFSTYDIDKEYGLYSAQVYGRYLYRIKLDKSEIIKIAHSFNIEMLGWLPDNTHFVFLQHGDNTSARDAGLYIEDLGNSSEATFVQLTTDYVSGNYIVWLPKYYGN